MEKVEIAIVGAGPAGLSAALYAARFCRQTLVLHDEQSRAARIPLTHNVPGFEHGIAGPDLLARMRQHATQYGAQFEATCVADVSIGRDGFLLTAADGRSWQSSALILATGVELNQIPLSEAAHEAAVAAGVLRYCPICDGYEHRGMRIAVVGFSSSGAAEALFLCSFSSDITLVPWQDVELTSTEQAQLASAGIKVVTSPVHSYLPSDHLMTLQHHDGTETAFDVLYPALGVTPRNALAKAAGLALNDEGMAPQDAPRGTDIPGLFCAGDIVAGLDQISVAMGHGAQAATSAHNWLREQQGKDAEQILGAESPAA